MRKTLITLVLTVAGLVCLGIVLIASAGDKQGLTLYKDEYFFLKHQAMWLVIAASAMAFAVCFDYHHWRNHPWLTIAGYAVIFVLLSAVLWSPEIKGSHRWLNFGPIRLQPSELAKFMAVISLSVWFDKIAWRSSQFVKGIIIPGVIAGAYIILLMREPDYGSTAVVVCATACLMYLGGSRFLHLLVVGTSVAALIAMVVWANPNRRARIIAWIQGDSEQTATKVVKDFSGRLRKEFSKTVDDKTKRSALIDRVRRMEREICEDDFVMDYDRRLAEIEAEKADASRSEEARQRRVNDDRPKPKLPKVEVVIQTVADLYKSAFLADMQGSVMLSEERIAKCIQTVAEKFKHDAQKSDNAKYQLLQATIAIRCGGMTGVGYNKSMQKQNYLPEAHTDFIFAIGAEEFGIGFSLAVVALFTSLFVCGVIVTFNAPDRLGRLLAFGMTFLLVFQAFFNIGVVTGCLPTKGLALPMISYGGTNLIASLIAAGILINVAWQASKTDQREIPRLQPI